MLKFNKYSRGAGVNIIMTCMVKTNATTMMSTVTIEKMNEIFLNLQDANGKQNNGLH